MGGSSRRDVRDAACPVRCVGVRLRQPLSQGYVARLVSIKIVDFFEAVEIDRQERHQLTVSGSARDLLDQPVLHVTPIGQTGKSCG